MRLIKEILYLERSPTCRWRELEYNDDNILNVMQMQLKPLGTNVSVEMSIWEYDNNECRIHVELTDNDRSYSDNNKCRSFEFFRLYCYYDYFGEDDSSAGDTMRSEAYRIKKLLAKSYPDIKVSSRFNWRGIV